MIPTSNHNEALSGDTLYSAFLNHEWREIVLPYIVRGMEEVARTITDESERQDFEIRYGAMVEDFYNEDVMDFTPVGSITAFTDTANIPAKWLLCNGNGIPQAAYPDLFALIGTKYGTSGAGTFRVPDLTEKFILGQRNDGGNLVIDETGGAKTHTLTTSEIPPHNHTVARGNGGGSTLNVVEADNAAPTFATSNTGNTGGGSAHNNMPPYHSLAWIIKALP